MKVSLFYLPSIGSRSEIEKGCAALRPELYTKMLEELGEQARLADDLGYDSISFTEHHFHVEGFEISNNPVMLDLFVGLQTKRIRVGQLGIVLPANNPIRVAEDIAMLDHMTGGRANAGFARGYQRRWVDVMAQQTHGIHGALPHEHDAIDEANRAAFEECFQIIVKRAWSDELLELPGALLAHPTRARPRGRSSRPDQLRRGRRATESCSRRWAWCPKPVQRPTPSPVPALCVVGAQHPLVRRARRSDRGPAAAAPGAGAGAVRAVRRGRPAGRSARAWACCAT